MNKEEENKEENLENLKNIEKQIKDQMYKAFFNLIDESINSQNPDYIWLSNLFSEIKIRLLNIVNKDGKIYKKIDTDFDVELFKQMIENKVFNYDSVLKLINNSFYWILQLQAPIRDEYTNKAKQRVLDSETDKIISTFLKELHICIDYIYEDIISYNERKKDI
jgi:hypothetical protein